MKIVSINLGNYSSTGNIAKGICAKAIDSGIEYYLAYPDTLQNKEKGENDIIIGNSIGRKMSVRICQLTGFNGCGSIIATYRFIEELKRIKPDIIHLHNLHNTYVNLPLLFKYIKTNNISVVWTLHDCWAFTGQCPYFTLKNCNRWKTGCGKCPQFRNYPASLFDNSRIMYSLKKKWFTGIKKLTIVTPSEWLGRLVEDSFLNKYPRIVINNGINLNIFKPTPSNFREKHQINGFIILGVAYDWGVRKGLDVFVKLSECLDKRYTIVLVGTTDELADKLPRNIVCINKTNNQVELAEIYSAADIFVNPTREENYPTVNMESIACGTPIITFRTGGSPEILTDDTGCVVEVNDLKQLEIEIRNHCENRKYTEENCLKHAKRFSQDDKYTEYLRLYYNML